MNELDFEKEVIKLLPHSNSMSHLCKNLGLRAVDGYYTKILKIIKKYNLSTSHFGTLKQINRNARNKYTAMADDEFFVKGIKRSSTSIIKRLINNGYKEYKCENKMCGIETWHGKKITLQVHHINGDHLDNRIENLQLLCPNCHSQTENYSKHNSKKTSVTRQVIDIETIKKEWENKQEVFCKNCNKKIKEGNIFCSHKCAHEYHRKFNPSNNELINEFKNLGSFTKVAKLYNVSPNAIKRRCIKNGIIDEVYKYIKHKIKRKWLATIKAFFEKVKHKIQECHGDMVESSKFGRNPFY